MVRGDQQHSGLQPDETVLGVRSVKRMRLLWKRNFSDGGRALSDPVMLGPIITNHGVKELVFVRNGRSIAAVDADLGTVFWQREMAGLACASVNTISPVMNWSETEANASMASEDHYSDGNRPLFVLASDGRVHVLRPSTGGELLPPYPLVPAGAFAGELGETHERLYALSSGRCGGVLDHIWSKRVGPSGLENRAPVQSAPAPHQRAFAGFTWNGKNLEIAFGSAGEPELRVAGGGKDHFYAAGRVATWKDKADTRWIYTSTGESLAGFRVQEGVSGPLVTENWRMRGLRGAGLPVIANAIIFFLSRSASHGTSELTLHAVNAEDGTELFQTQEGMADESPSGDLAVANGHVCFSDNRATLRCFGLPFTM